MFKYFKNLNTMEEVKKDYRKLALKFHPDRKNGNEEIFKIINNEYEEAIKIAKANELKKAKNKKEEDFVKSQFMNSKGFREKIDKLIKLDNIVIEICGTWLYISGKGTYNHKEYLKNEFGAFWSKSKKCWCISPQGKEFKKSRGYKGKTLNDIRNIYGSEKIKSKGTILIEGK